MKLIKSIFYILALLLITTASPAFATTLTTHITADDGFTLYISTNDSELGTYVGTYNWWYDTQTYDITLTSGVTNYIHIVAWDSYGKPTAILGDFSLSDNMFQFSNDSQSLVTNTANWKVYTDKFGGATGTLTSFGANGVEPWGTRNGIDNSANWIWTDDNDHTTRYFSSAIPVDGNQNTPVPEPSTLLLLGVGLAGAGLALRKTRG